MGCFKYYKGFDGQHYNRLIPEGCNEKMVIQHNLSSIRKSDESGKIIVASLERKWTQRIPCITFHQSFQSELLRRNGWICFIVKLDLILLLILA